VNTSRAQQNFRANIRPVGETLLVAAAGGCALGFAGFPDGWLAGAIIAVSVAALAGRPMSIPDALARVTYVVMGTSLGSTVTPATIAGMARWPASLVFLTAAMFAITVAVAVYLRFVHGWDRASALLGSFPGALGTSLVLAVEVGADVRAVAVVQTTRVAGLAIILPAGLAAFGFAGVPIVRPNAATLAHPGPLVLLLGVSGAIAAGIQRLGMPGGLIFGAMVTSAGLHGTGIVTVTLPVWMSVGSFIVLGGVTGTRFGNTDVRLLRHLAGAAFGAFVVANVVAFTFALVSAKLLALTTGGVILAYAPGAIDAMMILALALHLDPAFVGAHHLARFVMVLLTMPVLVRFIQPKGADRQEAAAVLPEPLSAEPALSEPDYRRDAAE
jgi:membrane AbrB-like protein